MLSPSKIAHMMPMYGFRSYYVSVKPDGDPVPLFHQVVSLVNYEDGTWDLLEMTDLGEVQSVRREHVTFLGVYAESAMDHVDLEILLHKGSERLAKEFESSGLFEELMTDQKTEE